MILGKVGMCVGRCTNLEQIFGLFALKRKMGSNDWQLYPPMHKLHKRLVMIDMFSFREEDGLAKMKLKVL